MEVPRITTLLTSLLLLRVNLETEEAVHGAIGTATIAPIINFIFHIVCYHSF